MTDEQEELDPGEFRRMMAGVDREGMLRMVASLSRDIEANPQDARSLSARGWLYGELGDFRRTVE
ncbi:MAG: hypothetical protein OXN21_06035, partial [Chloroflexota bacterium]|nr:hypothetical protein [Chloroflexota bacterium]